MMVFYFNGIWVCGVVPHGIAKDLLLQILNNNKLLDSIIIINECLFTETKLFIMTMTRSLESDPNIKIYLEIPVEVDFPAY